MHQHIAVSGLLSWSDSVPLNVAYDFNMADVEHEICKYPANAMSIFGFGSKVEAPTTRDNSRLI